MYSQEAHCHYSNNQLGQVICQLRFPEILSIGANVPVAFQEAIRDEYPQYSAQQEAPPPTLTGGPGNFRVKAQPPTVNYHFISEDGSWRVNLTSKFISLSCLKYTSWEDFARRLDKVLVTLIQTYKPAYFERVGLRYMNFFSRNSLGLQNTPFAELINPIYLGPLADEEVSEAQSGCIVQAELRLKAGCRLKLHAGLGLVKRTGHTNPEMMFGFDQDPKSQFDQELKFIFDQDLFMPGKVPVNMTRGALNTLHTQAFSIFRGAITDTLHDAMAPTSI